MQITKSDVLAFLSDCYKKQDLQFIETVNNTTFSYRKDLHTLKKSQPNHNNNEDTRGE